jgi:hypothetical protein
MLHEHGSGAADAARPWWLGLRLTLGGAVCGFFVGSCSGALLGLIYGAIVGNLDHGLDGALVGGGLLGAVGGIYGATLALVDVLRRRHEG